MKFPFPVAQGRTFDVLGFGSNAVDHLITVPKIPGFASKVELLDHVQLAGGEAATTVSGLQRLGMRTAYAGSFGDDEEGSFGMHSLESAGVDISLSKRISGARTQVAFILIDAGSGERTVIWKRDALLEYVPDEALLYAMANCRILHMTPHDTSACITLSRKARDSGTLVSIDIDNIFDRIDELLPLVDILICSSDFPVRLTGMNDPREALRAMASSYGCAVVGMTLGEIGSVLLCNGSLIESKGFSVPGGCKDTTGAGDAFRTGLLYGILKGETVEDAARSANAVAALKCRAVGARTALPHAKELADFLTQN
jgi:sugar/nucleoside kinase (ribokinase family)